MHYLRRAGHIGPVCTTDKVGRGNQCIDCQSGIERTTRYRTRVIHTRTQCRASQLLCATADASSLTRIVVTLCYGFFCATPDASSALRPVIPCTAPLNVKQSTHSNGTTATSRKTLPHRARTARFLVRVNIEQMHTCRRPPQRCRSKWRRR